ncbi:MAG: hypothetical protein ACPGR8_01175 [Limisphaerales bacterium]
MSSWELNCCDGAKPIARRLRRDVLSGERAAVCLAGDIVLDCTVCSRDNPTCISSLDGAFKTFDVLLPIIGRLDTEQLELVLHKLATDGAWEFVSRLAARWPCTVTKVLDASTIPFEELAASSSWRTVVAFARAGVLSMPLNGALQQWTPQSLKGQRLKCELYNYSNWLNKRHAPSRLVLVAVRFALSKLPSELVDRICKLAGLLPTF